MARLILDKSDPGYRFWHPKHVQMSHARLSNAIWFGYCEILVFPVTPLEVDKSENFFGWLLAGTVEDVRKVHGSTGVCSKLLHVFATITQLSAEFSEVRYCCFIR